MSNKLETTTSGPVKCGFVVAALLAEMNLQLIVTTYISKLFTIRRRRFGKLMEPKGNNFLRLYFVQYAVSE